MDKKVQIPEDVHVMTAAEVAGALLEYKDKPLFFATETSGEAFCVLSIYEDEQKQVWIDIGPVDED